jgi:hypothetical protein
VATHDPHIVDGFPRRLVLAPATHEDAVR